MIPGESRWVPGPSGVGVMKSQILYIIKKIFIEVQLIYNVSGVQQSDSIYIFFHFMSFQDF